jgi:hypothetical protein
LFYAFDDAARERALQPYLPINWSFVIVGTKSDKWHFNDNLSTLSSAKINKVAQTVLFLRWRGARQRPFELPF